VASKKPLGDSESGRVEVADVRLKFISRTSELPFMETAAARRQTLKGIEDMELHIKTEFRRGLISLAGSKSLVNTELGIVTGDLVVPEISTRGSDHSGTFKPKRIGRWPSKLRALRIVWSMRAEGGEKADP
jgi:hypothetical protein